ncbi:MAG: hypothetical protein SGILL_000964 [Bacillariaceae sp.]
MERAAIFLILFLPCETRNGPSLAGNFPDFVEWFTEMEEEWDEALDDVIIAPFHPDWEFGTDADGEQQGENDALSYEKKSPFPLVSLVSTRVVEQAGEAVTSKIATHNHQILLDKMMNCDGKGDMEGEWRTAIYGEGANE